MDKMTVLVFGGCGHYTDGAGNPLTERPMRVWIRSMGQLRCPSCRRDDPPPKKLPPLPIDKWPR